MQNSAMATTPDKSKSASPKAGSTASRDFFQDTLPVPEATESNTDTAWGLWEHTLKAHEEELLKGEQDDFQDTMALDPSMQVRKP